MPGRSKNDPRRKSFFEVSADSKDSRKRKRERRSSSARALNLQDKVVDESSSEEEVLEEMVVESREDHATEDGFAFQVKRSKTIVKAKKIKKESKRASSRASSRTRRVEVEKEIEKEDAEPETPPQPRRKATIIERDDGKKKYQVPPYPKTRIPSFPEKISVLDAIRKMVNQEITAAEKVYGKAVSVVKKGGRGRPSKQHNPTLFIKDAIATIGPRFMELLEVDRGKIWKKLQAQPPAAIQQEKENAKNIEMETELESVKELQVRVEKEKEEIKKLVEAIFDAQGKLSEEKKQEIRAQSQSSSSGELSKIATEAYQKISIRSDKVLQSLRTINKYLEDANTYHNAVASAVNDQVPGVWADPKSLISAMTNPS